MRPKSRLMAEINIVPFTDVVLVLLVIFMVTTPFLFQGAFQVNLPKVAAPSPDVPQAITLTITEAGKVLLDGTEIEAGSLQERLKTARVAKPGATIMINADRNVPHGTVMRVMSEAYAAGVSKMGIAVEQDSAEPGASAPVSAE